MNYQNPDFCFDCFLLVCFLFYPPSLIGPKAQSLTVRPSLCQPLILDEQRSSRALAGGRLTGRAGRTGDLLAPRGAGVSALLGTPAPFAGLRGWLRRWRACSAPVCASACRFSVVRDHGGELLPLPETLKCSDSDSEVIHCVECWMSCVCERHIWWLIHLYLRGVETMVGDHQ